MVPKRARSYPCISILQHVICHCPTQKASMMETLSHPQHMCQEHINADM
jgi:hypothetical protein